MTIHKDEGADSNVPFTVFRNEERNSVLLKIDTGYFGNLPESTEFADVKYIKVDEMHVTVLGFSDGDKLKNIFQEKPAAFDIYINWLDELKLLEILPTDKYYKLTEFENGEVRKRSVIQMVHVEDLNNKIHDLEHMLELEENTLSKIPPHITLYIPENQHLGIGLYSANELANHTEVLQNGILSVPLEHI
jgi:hypothetical protein